VRVTAQVLESDTLATLWADEFDGSLEDVFDLQDRSLIRLSASSSFGAEKRNNRARQDFRDHE
jgi:TolB-like protein